MSQDKESLRLVSLNIEGHKRLGLVEKFLATTKSDVFLLQEVFAEDAHMLARSLRMGYVFAPMARRPLNYREGPQEEWGIAMMSPYPILDIREECYGGDRRDIPDLKIGSKGEPLVDVPRVFLGGTIDKAGIPYRVATTHFTWTPNGEASEQQRVDLENVLKLLKNTPEVAFAGDFNAPRGGEIHGGFAEKLRYWTPPHVGTTIDGKFHRAGHLQLVVDHLFTKGKYRAENVYLVNGVSDHWALMANIHRR